MKFIINENELENRIIKFLETITEFENLEEFDCGDMDYSIGCYIEQICYSKDEYDEAEFEYFPYPKHPKACKEENYQENLEYLPALHLKEETSRFLISLFGELWKEPFKKWFEKKYGKEVKTVFH